MVELNNFGDAVAFSVIGFLLVFFGLLLLMIVVYILGKLFGNTSGKSEPVPAGTGGAAPPVTPVVTAPAAPVTSSGGETKKGVKYGGEIDLYNVDDRTAAMIMAIVADEMQEPLGNLRFISIREVE